MEITPIDTIDCLISLTSSLMFIFIQNISLVNV